MMSCTEAFCTIMEHLRFHTEPELQNARHVLEAFGDTFRETDKVMEDKELAHICRRVARLHFSRPSPLATYPWQTIREVYKEKTGRVLSDYFCCMAYYRTIGQDKMEALKNAQRYAGTGCIEPGCIAAGNTAQQSTTTGGDA
ncbi:MAG TPA: hypothetical protein O0X84_01505 [Methanocorpusculum sp.]|nr:hypothetical protein [Methanocorpusculum sp.]HJJ58159.1 hypothetical protein [Methanocorpusculum sp.]